MTNNEMLTSIIHKYGFEHPNTIRFAWLVEKNDKNIKKTFKKMLDK